MRYQKRLATYRAVFLVFVIVRRTILAADFCAVSVEARVNVRALVCVHQSCICIPLMMAVFNRNVT